MMRQNGQIIKNPRQTKPTEMLLYEANKYTIMFYTRITQKLKHEPHLNKRSHLHQRKPTKGRSSSCWIEPRSIATKFQIHDNDQYVPLETAKSP